MKSHTRIEPLESRIAPATTCTVFGGVATFIGGMAADTLTLSLDAASGLLKHDRFAAGDAGYASAFDFNSFTPGVQTLAAGASSSVNFTDQGLNDIFVIDSSAVTGASAITVEAGRVIAIGGTQFRFDNSMQAVQVAGGSGDDIFTVRSTGNVSQDFTLDGGGGADVFKIGNSAGKLDDLLKPLIVLGGTGADTLIINDAGNANIGSTYALTASQTTRTTGGAGPAAISHSGGDIETYRLFTSGNDDFVTIDRGLALSSGVAAISVFTGTGNDTLFVKPNATSTIAIDGGDPADPTESDLLIIEQAGVINLSIGIVGPPIAGTVSGDNIGDVTFSNVGAPAITGVSPAKNSYTWLDKDGDLATLSVTGGQLSDADFTFDSAGPLKQLQLVNFADDGAEFAGISVSTIARTTALGGDGFVNVGHIDATGVSLGRVAIRGDLGQIDAAGLTSLKVQSLGELGDATQILGGDISSEISGSVGKVVVKTNLAGSLNLADGLGTLGLLKIGRNLTGAAVFGGDTIVRIGGSVLGGDADFSGTIDSEGSITTLTIGGSIVGGFGEESGVVFARAIGAATLGGSILGGVGDGSGVLEVLNVLTTLAVNGDLVGGLGEGSGRIVGSRNDGASLGVIMIGGSILGGGIFSTGSIGAIAVGGDLLGTDFVTAGIAAEGLGFFVPQPAGTPHIGSIAIGGSAEHASILGGFDATLSPTNADAQIGRIVIGGDFIASNIVAGIAPDIDGNFGTTDDTIIPGGSSAIVSRIAKVVVLGQALGDPSATDDSFAIEAQQIGLVKIGARRVSFAAPGAQTYPLGPFGDLVAREI